MVWWMALAWAGVVDTAGPVALDDRMPVAERVEALQELGEAGEAEVLWVVRAASQVDVPEVQLAALDAAAAYDTAEAAAILGWVLSSPGGEVAVREHALELLSSHGTPHAADQLYAAAIDRLVAARWRSAATRSLEANYPDLLAQRGPPKQAVDPMGGLAFVAANGMVGGVALSSVGVWGQFDGAPAIGAVGGAAMGLGLSGLYVSKRPLTTGQGLAYASGASWGLAASAWTTSVVHGPWTYLERGTPRWQTAQDAGAAYRLAGVGLGAGVGALWMRSDPAPWDVLEVDLAGYLGSAEVMAATEAATGGAELSIGMGLAIIGVGIPTAFSTIAAGIAVGPIGAASLAVLAEKPEIFGRTLIYLGLAEGIAIYGLVMSILLLDKL